MLTTVLLQSPLPRAGHLQRDMQSRRSIHDRRYACRSGIALRHLQTDRRGTNT